MLTRTVSDKTFALHRANLAFGELTMKEWILIVVPVWEFPEIRGTFLGIPRIRIIVFWGLYYSPPILGNYHISYKQRPAPPDPEPRTKLYSSARKGAHGTMTKVELGLSRSN